MSNAPQLPSLFCIPSTQFTAWLMRAILFCLSWTPARMRDMSTMPVSSTSGYFAFSN